MASDLKLKSYSSCELPISRVKTIMKSSPEVSSIAQESLFLIVKATVSLPSKYNSMTPYECAIIEFCWEEQ